VGRRNFAVIKTKAGVQTILAKMHKDGGIPYALDFETTGLRPEDAKIRLTAICGHGHGWVIDHHYAGPFSDYADDFARTCPFYVFNAGFEGRGSITTSASRKSGFLTLA